MNLENMSVEELKQLKEIYAKEILELYKNYECK